MAVTRTRIESWSKVTPYPSADSPEYWVVKSKSGDTYTFGMAGTSAPFYCLAYQLSVSPAVWHYNSWMLRQVSDVDSNQINYTYMTQPPMLRVFLFPGRSCR